MLTPAQFRERWETEIIATSSLPDDYQLVVVPARDLNSFQLSEACKTFLSEAGLPRSAGPCLSFDVLCNGLRRLCNVFAPGQWAEQEKSGFECYLMIGADGSGDPLCLEEVTGRVVMLDHEVLFDTPPGNRRITFVNSGISEFAESLLLFQKMQPDAHQRALREIDPPAFSEGAFWTFNHSG